MLPMLSRWDFNAQSLLDERCFKKVACRGARGLLDREAPADQGLKRGRTAIKRESELAAANDLSVAIS